MAVSFDPTNLVITLESGITSVNASQIYSDWKDWVILGLGAGIVPAFDTIGGDPLSLTQNAGAYFFLRNDLGWRIKPPEEDISITIDGNLFARNPSLPIKIGTAGNFNTSVNTNFSSLTQEVVINSGSGLSPQQATQLLEMYQDLGLDVTNAKSITENVAGASYDEVVSNITKEVRKSGVTTTVTRQ